MSQHGLHGWRPRRLLGVALVVLAVGLVGVANVKVTTRQGVNYDVTSRRIPLYLKTLELIDRSVQYQQIADGIARGASTDSDRALRVFDWTRTQIRATPDGWPVVDDHVLNVIIRGYGVSDQQADVFATLAT